MKKNNFSKFIIICVVAVMIFSVFSISFYNHIDATDSSDYDKVANMKFSDYKGYSVEYLLKNYNVVSFNDVKMNTHCMSGVLINGDLSGTASGFADVGTLTSPSYVKGSLANFSGRCNTRNGKAIVPLYVGSSNVISGDNHNILYNCEFYNNRHPIYNSNDFVDWAKLKNTIKNTSQKLYNQSTDIIEIDHDIWKQDALEIPAGSHVTIDTNGYKVHIRLTGNTQGVSTVLNLKGKNGVVSIPRIVNEDLSTSESGEGTAVIWNCIDASQVNITSDLSPEIGHVIAPNATVNVEYCNYNGCIICNGATINGEGHSHPYNGEDFDHTEVTVSQTVKKVWNDADDQDGLRPTSVKVQLLANGQNYGEPVIVTKKDNWTYTWKNLPSKIDNKDVKYTFKELDVDPNYDVSYQDNQIINTHIVDYRSIPVEKIWDDSNNQAGLRPDKITVELYANGKSTGQTIELNESNHWKGMFENLKIHQNHSFIDYTIQEIKVNGYNTHIKGTMDNGFVIENTLQTVNVKGTKTWKNVPEGMTYPTVTIELYCDGKKIDETQIKDGGSNYSFTNLVQYAPDGHEYEYTVKEVSLNGFNSEQIGNDFVNTYVSTEITKSHLILYKVDQDYQFLKGADFQMIKEDGTIIEPIKDKARFEFKDLDDGNYKIVETITPEGYEGIGEFNIVIRDGLITCPDYEIFDPFESLTIANTNDGMEPFVLGDEIDEEDYEDWILGDEKENIEGQDDELEMDVMPDEVEAKVLPKEVVETSDNENIMGYTVLLVTSFSLILFFKRKLNRQ